MALHLFIKFCFESLVSSLLYLSKNLCVYLINTHKMIGVFSLVCLTVVEGLQVRKEPQFYGIHKQPQASRLGLECVGKSQR